VRRPDLPQRVGVEPAGVGPGGQLPDPSLGVPDPSPAILEKIGFRFRRAVAEFAVGNDIPVIRFAKGERKLEVLHPHLDRLIRERRTGVAAIGMAQEFQRVFTGPTYHSDAHGGIPRFGYHKADPLGHRLLLLCG
jgi:hypothetical protein